MNVMAFYWAIGAILVAFEERAVFREARDPILSYWLRAKRPDTPMLYWSREHLV